MLARSFAHRARKVRVTLSTKRPSRFRPGRRTPIADRAVGPRCRPGRRAPLPPGAPGLASMRLGVAARRESATIGSVETLAKCSPANGCAARDQRAGR